jgi:hypothetical protein
LPSSIAKRSNNDPNKASHSNRQDQERKAVSRKVEPTSHRPVNGRKTSWLHRKSTMPHKVTVGR